LAAKAATSTIPIVFGVAVDPVEVGLVASLNRPGGNLTGVTNLNAGVGPKRIELLHELLPSVTVVGVLVDPTSPTLAEAFLRDLQPAAHTLGLQVLVLHASTERDFDTIFATLAERRAGALIIGPGAFFAGRGKQLGALTSIRRFSDGKGFCDDAAKLRRPTNMAARIEHRPANRAADPCWAFPPAVGLPQAIARTRGTRFPPARRRGGVAAGRAARAGNRMGRSLVTKVALGRLSDPAGRNVSEA